MKKVAYKQREIGLRAKSGREGIPSGALAASLAYAAAFVPQLGRAA